MAYAAVGLTPDCGVSYLLPRLVGERRALRMALDPAPISASEALDWGLVTEVVADDELTERVDDITRRLAGGQSHAYAEAKRLIRGSWQTSRQLNAADEARTISAAMRTPQAQRSITEFLNAFRR
jgi:2-(1,2-epoxy-1,2-dihydrophenyl)acetyl-CoA isomerase